METFFKILLWFGLIFSSFSWPLEVQPPIDFDVNSQSKLKVYVNFPLKVVNPKIERAVIVVHGVARNADEYFSYALKSAMQEGVENETLIIAPHFKIDSDSKEFNELYWSESWKFGDKSHGDRVSSYEIIDKLITEISSNGHFPSLKKVTLIGHSAGGQFVARYSAGSLPPTHSQLKLTYVIANPSSYLYFGPERWDGEKSFAIPDAGCPEYDVYPYGLNHPNSYMGQTSSQELQKRFNSRDIFLLLGNQDTLTEYLDMSCEANLQGKNRWERGLTYYRFIKSYFPESHLQWREVPGIGHSGEEMIQSSQAKSLLFH